MVWDWNHTQIAYPYASKTLGELALSTRVTTAYLDLVILREICKQPLDTCPPPHTHYGYNPGIIFLVSEGFSVRPRCQSGDKPAFGDFSSIIDQFKDRYCHIMDCFLIMFYMVSYLTCLSSADVLLCLLSVLHQPCLLNPWLRVLVSYCPSTKWKSIRDKQSFIHAHSHIKNSIAAHHLCFGT